LTGQHMGKRYLTIQPAKEVLGSATNAAGQQSSTLPLQPPEGCRTLFVKRLPFAATESDIAKAFNTFVPKLQLPLEDGHVRIARNSVTRQSKGFAYIDFESAQDLQNLAKAVSKRPLVMDGRTLQLDYDTGRVKGSFRTDTGRLWSKEKKKEEQQERGGGPRRK
jgi:RNA recognition motif-containing protein